jgi:YegS/Rv2252/BmrU family lipid kinase
MAPPRTLLVVNPRSQNGTLGKRWPKLSQQVRRHLGSFEEAFTKGPMDATRIAREAIRDGVDIVVAIGGDGTINEVANGFFEDGEAIRPAASMGILPFGTGGDFRKTVGIPKDIEKAAQVLARNETKRIDLGRLDYATRDGGTEQRMFVNIASFGMSGEIDEEVNSSSKRFGGRLTFMLATAKVGMRYKGKRVRVVFDGNEETSLETNISTIAVANGQYFGGGMQVAPNAVIDDGRFDVVSIGEMGTLESMWKGRHLYSGSHLNLDNVSERRARTVYAESVDGQEVILDVDGEVPGLLPATFTIVPQALSLVLP